MKTSTKAVMLSVLIFPGVGHFVLKQPLRGLAFLAPALAAVVYIMQDAVEQADRIAGQILSGSMPLDPAAMAAQIEQSSGNTLWANVASAVVLLCWIGAAADAWWLGRRRSD